MFKKWNWPRIFEFFIIGLVFGVVEDLIAIMLATDAKFDIRMLGVAFFVALPFAIFSELIVDHVKFQGFLKRKFNKE